MEAKQCAFT